MKYKIAPEWIIIIQRDLNMIIRSGMMRIIFQKSEQCALLLCLIVIPLI